LDDDVLKQLAAAIAKQRGYADFFDWPDKRQKELGILESFVEAATKLGLDLTDPRLEHEGKDPPDAWAFLDGSAVAIEITELVDAQLIARHKASGQTQWRWWTLEEVASKLSSIVRGKDHTGFGGRTQYWLLIHCDESAISHQLLKDYLAAMSPIDVRGLDRCFVLLSYDPSIQGCPLTEASLLRLHNER